MRQLNLSSEAISSEELTDSIERAAMSIGGAHGSGEEYDADVGRLGTCEQEEQAPRKRREAVAWFD